MRKTSIQLKLIKMMHFLAHPVLKYIRLSATASLLCVVLFLQACLGGEEADIALINQLQNGLKSVNLFGARRVMQEAMGKTIYNKDVLASVMKAVLDEDNYDIRMFGFIELSAAGTNIVPMLIDELRPLKPADRMDPLLVCLGRIGPDAKAALPLLMQLLNDGTFDEEYRIKLRVVMANLGYQAPGFMAQMQADIYCTNSLGAERLEGVAVCMMALVRARGWVQGDVTSQVVKALRTRGGTPVSAIITLGTCGKGQCQAVNALREMQAGLKDELRWNSVHAVIGFARYRLETKEREAYLRDSLRHIGSGPIGREEFPALILLSYGMIDDEILQRIIDRLNDSETAVRVGASRTLAAVGLLAKKAVPKLLELAKTSTSAEERSWACAALGTMAGADVLPELEQCLQHEQDDSAKYFIRDSIKLIKHEFSE